MKRFWTIAALACAALMVSCSSPEDKAHDFAKELKTAVEDGKSKKVTGVLKARGEYENVLSESQREKYDAAWVAAIEQEATDMAIAVIKAVKACDVAKVQELERKISIYKKALYGKDDQAGNVAKFDEIAKFDEAFNKRINDPDPKKCLKKEDMEKFNEALYIWLHPLEKLVVIEEKSESAEAAADMPTVPTEK